MLISAIAMRIAIGTARLADGVAAHEETLRRALAGGVRIVDTAASYGGGASERLIGKVLGSLASSPSSASAAGGVEVVSRFGFRLEGGGGDNNGDSGSGVPPGVPAGVKLGHSLDPAFMRAELTASRHRLGLDHSGGQPNAVSDWRFLQRPFPALSSHRASVSCQHSTFAVYPAASSSGAPHVPRGQPRAGAAEPR